MAINLTSMAANLYFNVNYLNTEAFLLRYNHGTFYSIRRDIIRELKVCKLLVPVVIIKILATITIAAWIT